jgi:hypothetical protein
MCLFSASVSFVANTNIFARSLPSDKQFLVYSMRYQADSELAMILPLPTPASPPEDAVRFIDLSNYPRFFDDMADACWPRSRGRVRAAALDSQSTLKVHDVGSFHASFVPRLQDFARLDSRFRLPDQTWEQMPQYKDYAFAVFKLQAGAKNVHPMAFEFPKRDAQELFFPTVHVHNGIKEPTADFDHALYFQTPQIRVDVSSSAESPANISKGPASQFMDIAKTQGIVDADAIIQVQMIRGMNINRDIVIKEAL